MALIDTSVLVAYLCPEPLHAQALRALNGVSARIITPLIQVEAASALAIKCRTGESDIASAKAVVKQLQRLIDDGLLAVREVSASDYRLAYGWLTAFSTPLRCADAIHLACALNQEEMLLTADDSLAKAAKTLGVGCKLIRS